MELFYVMWITTSIIGLIMEASFIMEVCNELALSGYKLNKKEIHKLVLPPAILFLPIFSLSFITAKRVKYMINPLGENLSEIKSDNLVLQMTNEEINKYRQKPTSLVAAKISFNKIYNY